MRCFPAACLAASRALRSKLCAWGRKRCGLVATKPRANWDGRRFQSMMRCGGQGNGSGLTAMRKIAIVAALEREVSGLIKTCRRVERDYQGRDFVFFEQDEMVIVCGGIGTEAARRAAEAVVSLYHPALLMSVGFAGALVAALHVGDIFLPAAVLDARDGSRFEI